jgi:3-hydroxyisobutyrate dehydrogenase/glyoxylate/succinic semialdehyde reductase
VEEVAFGEHGFVNKLKPNSIWIDCSTVNPSFTKSVAVKVKKLNIRFIDAPVAGTIIPAEKGELIFFVGGNKKDVEEVHPLFEFMGKKILHVGDNGKGTSIKMVINLILGQAMIAFSEGMVLGESLGFKKEDLFNVLIGGPVASPFLAGKKEKISKNSFEPEFPLRWMYKDFHLATLTGYENEVALPMTNQAKELYALANKHGFGEKDFSAIYEFLNNIKK